MVGNERAAVVHESKRHSDITLLDHTILEGITP